MSANVKAHILDQESGRMLARPLLYLAPRVGDEIRLSEDKFYKVELVCWVLDEPESPYQRVNIGVTKALTSQPDSQEKE